MEWRHLKGIKQREGEARVSHTPHKANNTAITEQTSLPFNQKHSTFINCKKTLQYYNYITYKWGILFTPQARAGGFKINCHQEILFKRTANFITLALRDCTLELRCCQQVYRLVLIIGEWKSSKFIAVFLTPIKIT
jgi:hypothetical protein